MTNSLINYIEKILDSPVRQSELYIQAFTHSSYVNDQTNCSLEHLERLEFLGDAVLEVCVSEFLYKTYSHLPEGELTKVRAAAVQTETLSKLARAVKFDRHIKLGRGEELSGGRQRDALLEDVFEAFLGAVYLDLGLEQVHSFLGDVLYPKILAGDFIHGSDYKTALQELLQTSGPIDISYEVIHTAGPAHAREFTVQVIVNQKVVGKGVGSSKKKAEQNAAREALENFK